MRVTIVGAGYVGLTTGAALAFLGHKVTLVEKDQRVIKALRSGAVTIYEYGLESLLRLSCKNMEYIDSLSGASSSDVVIIAVGTPSKNNGEADLDYVEVALSELAANFDDGKYPLIVNKSTVPPGTANRARTLVNTVLAGRGLSAVASVASNPEFLREGNALIDALYPDRIVLGALERSSFSLLEELYRPITEQSFTPPEFLPRPRGYVRPVLYQTDPLSAELVKYASNAFLAMKISFINEFAGLAELLDADITQVAGGVGLDTRIGAKHLMAGAGWGGSCFGKDARAITALARKYGYTLSLVEAAMRVNRRQRKMVVGKLRSALKTIPGSIVGVLGLAFKPGTDDIRDTPAAEIIKELLELGAFVRAYDPMAMANYEKQFPDQKIEYSAGIEELAGGCDALVLLTEWEQFKKVDWEQVGRSMKGNVFIDGRNVLDPATMENCGFHYRGIGRRVTPNFSVPTGPEMQS